MKKKVLFFWMGKGGIGEKEFRSTITVIQKAIKLSVDLISRSGSMYIRIYYQQQHPYNKKSTTATNSYCLLVRGMKISKTFGMKKILQINTPLNIDEDVRT